MNTNRLAFLTMLGHSEGTIEVPGSDNGYNVQVGGTLFHSYVDHPRPHVWIRSVSKFSSAAGRYQTLAWVFDVYKKQLHLPDFSPASQDAIALQMIGECKAFDAIDSGHLAFAVQLCRSRWASLPGAGYGQPENTLERLQAAYVKAGGFVAGSAYNNDTVSI